MTLPLPRPVFDANASGSGLGKLPDWDLSDLYPATDAPEFSRDMGWLEKACADFAADYEGKLATLDAAAMLTCVTRYEEIDVIAGRIMSFAGLRYYQNTMDSERAKFMADAQHLVDQERQWQRGELGRGRQRLQIGRASCRERVSIDV